MGIISTNITLCGGSIVAAQGRAVTIVPKSHTVLHAC